MAALALYVVAALTFNTGRTFAAPQRAHKQFGGGASIGNTGTKISFFKYGTVALSSGVASVADSEVTANTVVFLQRQSTGEGTEANNYDVAVTPGTGFGITALKVDNTTETGDSATIGYIEIDPGASRHVATPP